ncbi:MAG TPA: hypothetical protein VFV38_48975 [Ktedonobacteraceae bacterium]|nr:hypothetical protein [Ktedonobacteraceae bacterium]
MKDGGLRGLDAVVGRQGTRRRQRRQRSDRGGSDGLQIDRTSISVGPGLDGPALHAATSGAAEWIAADRLLIVLAIAIGRCGMGGQVG